MLIVATFIEKHIVGIFFLCGKPQYSNEPVTKKYDHFTAATSQEDTTYSNSPIGKLYQQHPLLDSVIEHTMLNNFDTTNFLGATDKAFLGYWKKKRKGTFCLVRNIFHMHTKMYN